MKRTILATIVATGIISVANMATVLAWHPIGAITKEVQNISTNGQYETANDNAHAVDVKTGDIVAYTITVRNDGAANDQGLNDLAHVVVADHLPDGLELVDTPETRDMSFDAGTIQPGKSYSKTYKVKVTETKNKSYIDNKTCYSGDSLVNDNPQHGCDDAVVYTNIPQTSSTSTTTPSVVTTSAPKPQVLAAATVPKSLPSTGIGGSVIMLGVGASVIGYATSLFVLRRKQSV